MSKILLLGDVHLGLGFPNKSSQWFKVHKQYFDLFLFPLLEKELCKDDVIVQLGDLFDNRSSIPIDVLNYAQYIVEKMSQICQFHIIVGNHDLYTRTTNTVNTVKLFKYIPNVFVYEEATKINLFGKDILMLPWVNKRTDQVELLKKYSGCDYLFCHSDLNGAKMHLTSIAHKNTDKISVEEFSGYKNVYSGHIHLLQRNKNFTFTGNVFQMDRNDYLNTKGIFILHTETGEEQFIENTISPQFKKLYLKSEDDLVKLDVLSTNDYIDLSISNTLLIGNRKLRRKLEEVLSTGSFSSVDYIDDINKTEDLITEEYDIEDLQNQNIEYSDIIREHINKQTYESKTKIGILSEFEEIMRIYGDKYK